MPGKFSNILELLNLHNNDFRATIFSMITKLKKPLGKRFNKLKENLMEKRIKHLFKHK